jgi:hypothetical protein
MKSLSKIALACLFAAGASSAFAAAQSAASISNIKFQVIDLNPMDGAPTFTFAGGNTSLSVSASDSSLGESESASRTRAGAFSFARTFEATLDHVSAQADISDKALQVEGAASGPGTSYGAYATTGYTGYSNAVLTLSPQSMVVITAVADVMASATNPRECGGIYYYYNTCSASESASASASMTLQYSYSTNNGNVSVNLSDVLSASAVARGAYTEAVYNYSYWYGYYDYFDRPLLEETKSDSRTFTAVFMNTSNLIQTASFSLSTNVSGFANTAAPTMSVLNITAAPVPEAEASLLALSGLGLLAATARRRRAV